MEPFRAGHVFFIFIFFFVDVLNFCVTQSDEKAESLLSFVPFGGNPGRVSA